MREWPPLTKPTFQLRLGDGFSVLAIVARSERTLVQGDLRLTFYEGVPVRIVFGMDLSDSPGVCD